MHRELPRRLGVSQRDLFDNIERPALRVLPAQDYAGWHLARFGPDYHVAAIEYCFYSVPHTLIRAEVDVRSPRASSRFSIAACALLPHSRVMRAVKATTREPEC
jgi:hypothetical protein